MTLTLRKSCEINKKRQTPGSLLSLTIKSLITESPFEKKLSVAKDVISSLLDETYCLTYVSTMNKYNLMYNQFNYIVYEIMCYICKMDCYNYYKIGCKYDVYDGKNVCSFYSSSRCQDKCHIIYDYNVLHHPYFVQIVRRIGPLAIPEYYITMKHLILSLVIM
jgi:hypothetical protein